MAGGSGRPVADRSFERLYQRHVADVYRYALAVLANRSDAEDVTQTTFLNAYRSYRSGTLPATPLNWLISIAHNVCRQRFRTAARRPPEVALDRQLAAAEEDGGRFRAEDIRRALAALTFAQRSALALRELEGRSYREIAETLQLSEGAVEALIFRARKAFREQLEGALTCSEAEQAISRQLDDALAPRELGALRSHLRECEECSVLARRFRAQQSAFKRFILVPLPQSLAGFSAGGSGVAAGGAAVGAGLGIKALALGSAAIVAVGVTTGEIVTHTGKQPAKTPAPLVHRNASPSVRPAADVPGRMVSAAATAVVAPVRPARAEASSTPVRRKGVHLHTKRPRPEHPAHPTSGGAHVAESAVVVRAVSHGNSDHGGASPAPKHATPTLKPKHEPRPAKRVKPAARRATHSVQKKEHPATASHRASASSPNRASPATDPAAPADQAKETGKSADTPAGQPDSQGQGKDKH
jgi:RNA polymerase sigma factor (sigma-70 family)